MPQQPQLRRTTSASPPAAPRRTGGPKISGSPFGALILGICIIVSAVILGGKITKLSAVIQNKAFTTDNISSLAVTSPIETPYLNENQAAQYLGFSDGRVIVELIEEGAFAGYVTLTNPTPDATYIISKDALDNWFKTYARKEPGKPTSVSPSPNVNNGVGDSSSGTDSNSSSKAT